MQNLKCVLVGDGAVGKTCMLISYTQKIFPEEYVPTGVEPAPTTVAMGNNSCVLDLYDTSGQEDYDRLRPLSYVYTDVFLVCFSVISPSSFKNIKTKWVPEILHHSKGTPFLVVGTKADLRNDPGTVQELERHNERPITVEQGRQLAKDIHAASYVECSARTRACIDEVIHEAIRLAQHRPLTRRTRRCTIL